MNYTDFLAKKVIQHQPSGLTIEENQLSDKLFDFQKYCVNEALRVGRFGVFLGTGLGKGHIALTWADTLVKEISAKVLLVAPLAVAKQFLLEAVKFDKVVNFVDSDKDIKPGVNITNYEKLHKLDCSKFDAVVLDESSILKDATSKTCKQVIELFANTPYKLVCSATPAPNDAVELGTQAEFLGVMSAEEMKSMFFTHDGSDTSNWILKGHAKTRDFYRWLSSWCVMASHPRDLGFNQGGYDLPEINYHSHMVSTNIPSPKGQLIYTEAKGLNEQRKVRKLSMRDRCELAKNIVDSKNEQWLVWCETNDESSYLASLIPDATEIKGSDSIEKKVKAAEDFATGDLKILITKPSIYGFGLNWQSCSNVIYIGLTHSFEQYYQSVRRVYRFGQEKNVNVHIIQHELEGAIERNLRAKENEAIKTLSEISKFVHIEKKFEKFKCDYNHQEIKLPNGLKTIEA